METVLQLMVWFLAVLAVNALCLAIPRNNEARAMGLLLGGLWLASNALVGIYGVPEGMRLYPLLDLMGGVYAFAAWRKQPVLWSFALLWSFVLLVLCHAAFWLTQWFGYGAASVPQYTIAINGLFAVQLICVGWPGGVGVAEHLRIRLRGRRGLGGSA